MNPDTTARLRTLLSAAAVLAVVVLAFFALQSIEDREAENRQAMVDELHDRLQDKVDMWETGLLRDLDAMLNAASVENADPAALQQRWQRQHPWFDALYVWTTGRPNGGSALSGAPPEVIFRFPARRDPRDDTRALAACTQSARSRVRELPDVDARGRAAAWIETCPATTPSLRAYLTAEAAQVLRRGRLPQEALDALGTAGIDDSAPLRNAAGVPVARRLARRALTADLLDDLGRYDEARALRVDTVTEVLSFDAPELETTLYLLPAQLDAIERQGGDVAAMRQRMRDIEQRLAAYREIRQTGARTTDGASEAARFTYDQYSDAPYLLYSRRTPNGRLGIALQLRQDRLLQTFLQGANRFDGEVAVTDISGSVVAGTADLDRATPPVAFSRTLRHLHAAVGRGAIDQRVVPATQLTQLLIIAVTGLCLVMVALAIGVQVKATALYRDLLKRQREFTARVTHELKTPLAGIRVMAENLSSGAVRDDAQRTAFALRIVEEADRLTARVNEVLAVAQDRPIGVVAPFDLEERLLELVDTWGPRYEQAGITLVADLAPIDRMLGDGAALRDAVGQLLDNALKYRRDDVESTVWLNTREDEDIIEIEVVDNGLGVPHNLRRKIFERFVRVEGPNRGKSGGHGLGLAQVGDVVVGHGGTITCEDGVDGGARFVIRLPFRRA